MLDCSEYVKVTVCVNIISVVKVAAPAKAGAIATVDVTVPAQCTTLGPEKTSFFQALAIQTKITKGTIEILVSEQSLDVTCQR
jgi:hypothetical protein